MGHKVSPPETFKLERIRLRRPALSDAEAIFEYGSDPEVARYADWPARTNVDQVVQSLSGRAAQWESGEEFSWVITLREDDRAIGGVTCHVQPDSAEIGFLLNRRYWGQGLATEAARAVMEWLLSIPSIHEIWATCDTENLASRRVLEKLGLIRQAVLRNWIVRPNISDQPRDAYRYAYVRPLKK
jgi:ribosomal-protein-alanine N-acetyltransferase